MILVKHYKVDVIDVSNIYIPIMRCLPVVGGGEMVDKDICRIWVFPKGHVNPSGISQTLEFRRGSTGPSTEI